MIDPTQPFLANRPSEWPETPEQLLMLLVEKGENSPEYRAMVNRIAASRHFLIRNDFSAPCRHHKSSNRFTITMPVFHEYITLNCRPAPFNGLRSILWFAREVVGADLFFTAFKPTTLEPITAKRARTMNDAIRATGEQPIDAQRPIQPEEVNADLMTRRIWRDVRSLRQSR